MLHVYRDPSHDYVLGRRYVKALESGAMGCAGPLHIVWELTRPVPHLKQDRAHPLPFVRRD